MPFPGRGGGWSSIEADPQKNVADGAVVSCRGFCARCGREHRLPFGNARDHAREVMEEFRRIGRLDYRVPDSEANPDYRFDRVFSGERGHMFGVMEAVDDRGRTLWLRAFSSLHGGIRRLDGWVPPILDEEDFREVLLPGQQRIKRMTREKNALPPDSAERGEIETERREFSRRLMKKVHGLYRFRNFRGEVKPLSEVFVGTGGWPGGVGDCCAPKLLQEAARRGLRPRSLAEFYWGGENRSGRKKPGQFFAACEEKCQPILGYLLCGLDENDG